MKSLTQLTLLITLILSVLIIGCNREMPLLDPSTAPDSEHTETLIIGPYTETCVGAFEQQCYLEFNEENQEWEFFYESIQGFDFEPGYIYRLKVSLHEREEGIQDVGRYAYHLVEVLSKEEASVDEKPPRNP